MFKRRLNIKYWILLSLFSSFLLISGVSAASDESKDECISNCAMSASGGGEAYDACAEACDSAGFGQAGGFAAETAGAAGVDTQSTLESKVASIVNYALSLLGIIFLLLMVYGGYIWMMARGDEGEAKRAKDIITMGVIGLAIVIAAYAITFFIVQRLVAGAA